MPGWICRSAGRESPVKRQQWQMFTRVNYPYDQGWGCSLGRGVNGKVMASDVAMLTFLTRVANQSSDPVSITQPIVCLFFALFDNLICLRLPRAD